MSLRTALVALPDDRGTSSALREILAFFSAHAHTDVSLERLERATGLGTERLEPVLDALCSAAVLHCDGDTRLRDCSFDPDHVLTLEIERFLRTAGAPTMRLLASVGRYRNRFGSA